MKTNNVKERQIYKQIEYWQRQKPQPVATEPVDKENQFPFITISREYGCGGYEVAEVVVSELNHVYKQHPIWGAYDKQILDRISQDMGITEALAETLTGSARRKMTELFQTSFSKFPPQVAVYRKLAEVVRMLAINGHVVIVGRAGNAITRDMPYGMHVRVVAPLEWKIERLVQLNNIAKKDAKELISTKTEDREGFLREFVNFDPRNSHNYDLVINNSDYSIENTAMLIIEALKLKGIFNPASIA